MASNTIKRKRTKKYRGLAGAKVADVTELLEMILIEVGDMKTILLSQRVNQFFRNTIAGSKKLRQLLWLELPPEKEGLTLNPLLDRLQIFLHPRRDLRAPLVQEIFCRDFSKVDFAYNRDMPKGSWEKMFVSRGAIAYDVRGHVKGKRVTREISWASNRSREQGDWTAGKLIETFERETAAEKDLRRLDGARKAKEVD